ncbi:hypothetical protein ACU4GA_13800 [Methylobacterium oryzae CBMB20]
MEDALVIRRGGDRDLGRGAELRRAAAPAGPRRPHASWRPGTRPARLTISEAGRARLRCEARPGDLAFAAQHRDLAVVEGRRRADPAQRRRESPRPG